MSVDCVLAEEETPMRLFLSERREMNGVRCMLSADNRKVRP